MSKIMDRLNKPFNNVENCVIVICVVCAIILLYCELFDIRS
jgi:hypothetical protein